MKIETKYDLKDKYNIQLYAMGKQIQYNMEDPLQIQVAGNHYKKYKIQPIEYFAKNKMSAIQSYIIKYVVRYKDKHGTEDIRKALHCSEIGLEIDNPTIVDLSESKNFCLENNLDENQTMVVLAVSSGLYNVSIHLLKTLVW